MVYFTSADAGVAGEALRVASPHVIGLMSVITDQWLKIGPLVTP